MRCFLIMHSAQGSLLSIEGNITLDQAGFQAIPRKLLFRPAKTKKATFVLELFKLDDKSALKICLLEDHAPGQTVFTSGMGMMNRPPRCRYSDCCSRISLLKFQVSSNT